MRNTFGVIIAVLFSAYACTGVARTPAAVTTSVGSVGEAISSPLYQEIAKQDSNLTAAFNAHDLDALMMLFSADLEFYHDVGGLQSFADVRTGFERLFAKNDGIARDLVPGTLKIFPVKGYGAVELGTHRFCHRENGRLDCGSFEFVELWKRVGTTWKIARVVSYGH